MRSHVKRLIAVLLAVVQLVVLFPYLSAPAAAAETPASSMPALNRTIVGTVQFQSFNSAASQQLPRQTLWRHLPAVRPLISFTEGTLLRFVRSRVFFSCLRSGISAIM